jgi:SAM-dependent methyltransferase
MNGWDVTGVDMKENAVPSGLMEASKNKMSFDATVSPKDHSDFGVNEWDLIVHVYKGCFDNSRISKIAKALKPGGILVFEFFHREAGIAMKRPTFGCETNSIKELIDQTGMFTVFYYLEEVGIADCGLRNAKLIKLVAAKK